MEDARFPNHPGEFSPMNSSPIFPRFDDCFSDLNLFLQELVQSYEAGDIRSWDDLDQSVKSYFTAERMKWMESLIPGWQKMASYTGGITLVHVMCVFLGMLMLPEFKNLTPQQQQLAKWIILFHDIDKFHIPGKKDPMHAFRSGAVTGTSLGKFGFPMTEKYPQLIDSWYEHTLQAFVGEPEAPRPDNQKLPEILRGIDQLFGTNTPAALITKTVLLHISLDVDPNYPTPAPLTEHEAARYIGADLFPLLRVMMLSDNEGWSLFKAETRARQRKDTLSAFAKLEQMISGRVS